MKVWKILIPIGILVLLWGGCSIIRARSAAVAEALKSQRPTAKIETGDISVTVVESGTIEAVQSVEVKSRVSGRVQKLLVKEGDRIEKGQLIAIIDPEELDLQLRQSSAQLRAAESSVARSKESISITEKQLQTAVINAEARLRQAERDWRNQPELSRTAVEQARLVHEAAIRTRDLLLDVTHPQERVQVDSNLQQAEAGYLRDQANHDRVAGLLQRGFVPEREMDDAKARLAAAKAQLETSKEAKRRLDEKQRVERANADERVKETRAAYEQTVARSNVDKNKEQALVQAKADFEQAKADIKRIQLEKHSYGQAAAQADQIRATVADSRRLLAETEIRAPMSGFVTKRLVEAGELVSALNSFSGGTAIVEVADLTALQVRLLVNEIDVAKLAKGVEASVEVDALITSKFKGIVDRIAPSSISAPNQQPAATDAVVKYEVIVTLAETDVRIRPGMSARCTMSVQKREDTLRVPAEFVTRDDDGYSVLLKTNDPKNPEKRTVKIGVISPSHYEILEGVKAGDEVVKPEYTGPPRTGVMDGGN